MKIRKHINVANKIATYDKLKEGIIVCGNSNYEIEFTFDSEWDAYPTKKARFTTLCDGEYRHVNVEFTDTVCPVPPIFNTTLLEVGVFIDGGISTTVAAEIKCRKSALCRASKSMLSPEQITGLNEALKGEQGPAGADGKDGKDGYTPQKGTDYWTDTDKKQIVTDVKTELKEPLDNKLDKTTDANKVYGTDGNGEQTAYNVDDLAKDKVDKINKSWILYGNAENNKPTYYYVSEGLYANGVVRRDNKKDVLVPEIPSSNSAATSKKYVDTSKSEAKAHANTLNSALAEKQTALEKRVTELENLTLTHIEDEQPSTVIWPKSAPRDCGSPAFIKRIEGKTERVPVYSSKNLFNSKLIEHKFEELKGDVLDDYVYNDDGTITYTVSEYAEIAFNLSGVDLDAGVYYVYVEGAWADLWGDGVTLFFEADTDEELMDFVTTTRTLKVMIYKDESGSFDYWDTLEAPEGTVFEPYAEPTYILKHQNVSSINCYTANLFGGSALKEAIVSKYPTAVVDEINKTITLSRGNYTIPMPPLVKSIDGAFVRFVVKGQGTFTTSLANIYDETSVSLYTSSSSPIQNISDNSDGYPINEMWFEANSQIVLYYEECGIFIDSVRDGYIIQDVSEFQPYQEEPIGTFIVPNQYWTNRGVEEYKNTLEWIDDEFVATERVRDVILNGTEGWTVNEGNSSGAKYFYFVYDTPLVAKTCICNAYDRQDLSIANKLIGVNVATVAGRQNCIIVRPENADSISVSDFKAQLAKAYEENNPVVIEAVLVTPKVTRYPIEEVLNELPVKSLGIIRFLDDEGNVVDRVGNSIAYVVRKGDTNNAYEE